MSSIYFLYILKIFHRCDTLLIVGGQSECVKDTEELYKTIQKGSQGKSKTSLIKIEKVGDVLTQKADKVAEAILFFCQVALPFFADGISIFSTGTWYGTNGSWTKNKKQNEDRFVQKHINV